MCCLCLKEKFLIMFAPVKASLNKRSEVYASCWHRLSKTFFLLVQKTECFLFNHFCTLDDFVQLYSLSGMDLVFFFLQQPFSLLHPHILLDFMYHKSGMRIFIKSLSKFSNKPYMQRCILNHALPYQFQIYCCKYFRTNFTVVLRRWCYNPCKYGKARLSETISSYNKKGCTFQMYHCSKTLIINVVIMFSKFSQNVFGYNSALDSTFGKIFATIVF